MFLFKSEIVLPADAFLLFRRDSSEAHVSRRLYFFNMPRHTNQCNLQAVKQEVEYIRNQKLYLSLGSGLQGKISAVQRP